LRRLKTSGPEDAVRAFVDAAGELDAVETMGRAGARQIPQEVARLAGLVVSGARLRNLEESLVGALRSHHQEHPLDPGLSRESLRTSVDLPGAAFDALVASMDGVIDEGATVRLETHSVALTDEQRGARKRVLETIEHAGFSPPFVRDLDADPDLLRSLEQSGDIVRIGDFYLTRDSARRARARVRDAIEARGPLTVAQIRDVLGTTRKYAVPLCEWLDGTGATLRRGDLRLLGPHP
jgi:selenocysteine-specific elongation factor